MSESLSNMVYDVLLDRILSNKILPGEFINRRKLAAELGVSVAPVLEAMVLMENEGLLETLPRTGTRVTIVRDTDISGTLLIREALECLAARMYCGEPLKRKLSTLIPLAQQVDSAPPRSHAYFSLDRQLHRQMVDLCGCEVYSREYDRITKLSLFHNTNKLITSSDAEDRQNHSDLLIALSEAAPDDAYRLMHNHIISGKGVLALTRDRMPSVFDCLQSDE
ncbi:GntR family transcriptional regulator [Ruminococcaceae bacterium OttesenSCG-928-L11]|nr:GntR family transcriptional regulator [Ruminococcaceae bacterium OttesenSCG-928-L11]